MAIGHSAVVAPHRESGSGREKALQATRSRVARFLQAHEHGGTLSPDMGLLFAYAALALAVSFVCSVLEAVLLSVTPSYVAALRKRNARAGTRLERLKEDVDEPLAAILSLNTISHTVGAAGVGAQAQVVFGSGSIAVVSAVLTLLILVVSEIIPKTIGATHWKALAPFTSLVLVPLVTLMWPLVVASRGLTRLFTRHEPETTVDREEFAAFTDLASKEGVLDRAESSVLRSLMHFKELRGADIMTPRTVLLAHDENDTVASVTNLESQIPFSRIPVYRGQIDQITGYVLKHDILLALSRDEHDRPLSELKREIVAMPQSTPLPAILDSMLRHREHIVLLVDEFGGCAGIVTMEDVVETLLGVEIVDETDESPDMQALARRRWARRQRNRAVRMESPDAQRTDRGPFGGEAPGADDEPAPA